MCLSNKAIQFQAKGGISDGALRVTYYDSRGIVSSFIFHIADLTYGQYAAQLQLLQEFYHFLQHHRAKSISMASYMIICHTLIMVLVYCNQSKYGL